MSLFRSVILIFSVFLDVVFFHEQSEFEMGVNSTLIALRWINGVIKESHKAADLQVWRTLQS